MTLRTPAFNDAKQYDFAYLRHLAETLLNSEGVANYQTDMVVTNAATGLRVDIAAGAAWVKGDSGTPGMGISQGLFSVVNDAAVANAVTLPAAHATNPRLDAIVLKVRDSSDLGSGADDAIFDYVQGTATAGATLLNRNGAAAIPNDCLHLADVLVPATATNLTSANVRDRRLPANGRAARYIPTAESTTSTSHVELATPDTLEAYVPARARVELNTSFLAKRATSDGEMLIQVTDLATLTKTPVKYWGGVSWSNKTKSIASTTYYDMQGVDNGAGADRAFISTAMDEPSFGAQVFGLPAGIYRFSLEWQAGAAGTVFAKERTFRLAVIGHGRSA